MFLLLAVALSIYQAPEIVRVLFPPNRLVEPEEPDETDMFLNDDMVDEIQPARHVQYLSISNEVDDVYSFADCRMVRYDVWYVVYDGLLERDVRSSPYSQWTRYGIGAAHPVVVNILDETTYFFMSGHWWQVDTRSKVIRRVG
jgi:hypothetical protein